MDRIIERMGVCIYCMGIRGGYGIDKINGLYG